MKGCVSGVMVGDRSMSVVVELEPRCLSISLSLTFHLCPSPWYLGGTW